MKVDIVSTFKKLPHRAVQEAGKVGSAAISGFKRVFKKADTYQKPDVFKLSSKETLLGGGMLAVGTILAIACIKGIVNKIKETRHK